MRRTKNIHKRDVIAVVTGLFLFWIILTGDRSPRSLLFGFLLSLFVGLVTTKLTIATVEGKRKTVKEYFFTIEHLVGLIFSAIFRIIVANIQLIYQVITLRIDPKVVRIKVDLSSDAELTLISHLITVTPGTLVIDVHDAPSGGAYLYVHYSSLKHEVSAAQIENNIGKWHDMIGALFK